MPNSTSVVHENLVSANFELSCLIFLDEVEEHEDNVAETLQVSADFTQTLAKSTAFPLILQVSISSMLIQNVFTVVFMSSNDSTINNRCLSYLFYSYVTFFCKKIKLFTD